MKLAALPLALFFILSSPREERVVTLAVQGLTAAADYINVRKALASSPKVARALIWIEKDNYHLHVVIAEPLLLSTVTKALAAAEKELKDTLKMEVHYALDEDRLTIASAATVTATGGDAVRDAIALLVPVSKSTRSGSSTEILIAPKDGTSVTVGALRKAVKGAGEKLIEVTLPGIAPPRGLYACPKGCAESNEAAMCPMCHEELKKQAEKPSAGG